MQETYTYPKNNKTKTQLKKMRKLFKPNNFNLNKEVSKNQIPNRTNQFLVPPPISASHLLYDAYEMHTEQGLCTIHTVHTESRHDFKDYVPFPFKFCHRLKDYEPLPLKFCHRL